LEVEKNENMVVRKNVVVVAVLGAMSVFARPTSTGGSINSSNNDVSVCGSEPKKHWWPPWLPELEQSHEW